VNFSNDTCTSEVLKNYLFCTPINDSKCHIFDDTTITINGLIANLTVKNQTREINETINALENLLKEVNVLLQCNNTKYAYGNITTITCGQFTTFLMEASFMMEFLSALSFLFLMTFFFSLHRLGVNNGEVQDGYIFVNNNDNEFSMKSGGIPKARRTSSFETNRARRTSYRKDSMSTTTQASECGSIGCFIYTFIIIGLWGVTVFTAGFAIIYGGGTEDVKRF